VRGLGTIGYRGVALDDKTRARTDAVSALLDERVRPALADVHSVWGSGVGLPCEAGAPIGAVIDLSSWRDVDRVIAIVSGILDSEHLGEIVSIEVDGIPVADVGG
jgi:hypothetical protein